ncbi:MAG TPA: hypothetical protein VMF10_15235 [Candidatus Aquilonibacter sp.]|nr:hypothetical protein [Candidatus Aquilonibacter sp.]
MYKKISLVALVVTVALLVGHSVGSSPEAPPSPVIVRAMAFPNQTAPIPLTPLFTPTINGLYRVSAYMTEIAPVSTTNNATSFVELTWTDDAGPEDTGVGGPVSLNTAYPGYGSFVNGGPPGGVAIIEGVAGKPVNFEVSVTGNSTEVGTYSLYLVVERLN